MVKYTLEMVDGVLAVVSSNAKVLPIEILDKDRMVSNHNQIGRRYWDSDWRCWGYEILDVKPGTDVTGFIGGE